VIAANIGQRFSSEPLKTQIMRADERLRDRRCRVDASAAMLGRSVRKELTSPLALLLAGGLGFVAGDFATRGSGTAERADDSRAPGNHFFASVLSIVTLVRSLLRSIQALEIPTVRDHENCNQER
jgi:hypothetical protein